MGHHPTKEADLFQAVHDLFWQQGNGERRNGPRHPYKCTQLVAPYNGGPMPRQQEFSWVECKNLSARGFSFFWPEPPAFQHVVVALGGVPFIFLVARIMHFGAEGEHFLCGCQFQKRINRTLGKADSEANQPAELDRSLLDLLVPKTAARPLSAEPKTKD